MERSKRATQIAIIVLFVFHLIGLVGFSLPETQAIFQRLVPLNLLLSIGLLGYFHQVWNRQFAIFCGIIFAVGYGVEVAGVNTGLIFGEYVYDIALGPKLWSTPPMIGINWLMLVYSIGVVLQNLRWNKFARAALGASGLMVLDIIMEPVAIAFKFWHWLEATIPLQNYLAWWLIAFSMLLYFFYLPTKKQNPLAGALLIIQFFFFGCLRFVI